MGRSGRITGVSGYTEQAPVAFMNVKAGEAITAGNVVAWSASADDGYTVVIAGTTSVPCGVAMTDADSGDFFRMQTKGLNQVALVTDGGVADGEYIYCAASGAVDSAVVTGVGTGDLYGRVVGVALADDSSTSQAVGTAVLFPLGGYGMSTAPTISGVTGYDEDQDVVIQTLKAAGTITAGDVVCWGDSGDSTDSGEYGLAVVECGAAQIPCGVALEAASSGDYVRVQTVGPNKVAITTNGSVAAGNFVYAIASGAVSSGGNHLVGNSDTALRRVGVALAADSSTTSAVDTIFLNCFGGW